MPGLLLALAVAIAVLAVNRHWLLPSLDETGIRYLVAAPQLAAGAPPAVPIASWDADAPTSGLEGVGTLMPLLMAALSSGGARAHVAALWVLAGSAALTVLAITWSVGGAAGLPAALLAGTLVVLSPATVAAATAVQPALLLASLVALLVGTMTYQPRWSPLHGLLGALAWLTHPAGVGAVAAAMAWPAAAPRDTRRRPVLGGVLAGLPALCLLGVGIWRPLLAPPSGPPHLQALRNALPDALRGLLGAAAPLPRGWWGPPIAALLVVALGFLTVAEGRATPEAPPTPHWSDPAAADVLARRLRRAVGLTALAMLVGAAWAGRVAGGWLPIALLLPALAAAGSARWARRMRGAVAWTPVALLLLWGTAGAWSAWGRVTEIRTGGRDLTTRVWVSSEVVRWLDNRARPYGQIYASEPALVVVQGGRAARTLPPPGADADAFARRFAERPGAVVLTGGDATDERAGALADLLGLREVVRAPEGRVLVPNAAPAG